MEEEKEVLEKNIDIKATLAKLVEGDEPEQSQEEAIMNFSEQKRRKYSSTGNEDSNGENTEEQEHMKRVKRELLASLDRVKALEDKIYGEHEEKIAKNKLKVNTSGGKQQQNEIGERQAEQEVERKQQERE